MKILEILESVRNSGKIFDILGDNRELSREIRQVYNKLRRKHNIGVDEKRYTRL
jgi:hypothetical protein